MAKRADVIREARSWIGTPWRHQGRTKGWSCDCVGVLIGAGVACSLLPPDFNVTGYSRSPAPAVLISYLEQYLDRVDKRAMKGGDALLLKPHRLPQHVGILTFEHSLIHAIDRQRGVREHRIDDRWDRAIVAVYRFRGLED
jgi:NlpC/P60 family putative phage cell wall peptidase